MPKATRPLLREALPKPLNKAYDLFKLYDWVHRGIIDLSPTFQRDVVWSLIKMQGLIDSVMKNYYIPPLLFSAHVTEDGKWVRHCIDGKQRLSSVMRFMDGQFPYVDDAKQRWYYTLPPGQSGCELPEDAKKAFADACLVCVEYHNINSTQERESFRRVQLGVALSTGEKLYAIESPTSERIHALHEEYSNLDTIIDAKRSKAFLVMSQSVMVITDGSLKYQSGQRPVERFLLDEKPISDSIWRKIKAGFSRLSQSVDKAHHKFMEPGRVAPIEFVFLGVLFYYLSDRDERTIFQYIKKMRTRVRQVHDDIRSNNRVWRTLADFLKLVLEKENLLEREDESDGVYDTFNKVTAAARLNQEIVEQDVTSEDADEIESGDEFEQSIEVVKMEPDSSRLNANGKRHRDNDFFALAAGQNHKKNYIASGSVIALDVADGLSSHGKRYKPNHGGTTIESDESEEILDSGVVF